MKKIRISLWAALCAAAVLSACGGGSEDTSTSTSGSTGGTGGSGNVSGTDTQSVATSLSFTSLTPTDHPLIIQGTTASGRTDTGVLKFKLVDQVGAAVPNKAVNFSVVPAGGVTLNITSATTDANGVVTASVTSKSAPTTVVVKAVLASNASINAVSDTLTVSGGDPVSAGFQVVAAKYNLDGQLIGDSTSVSAYVRDAFGNPVADGFAVSFTTDYGAVGGSCTTVSGQCSVNFTVQNPRGAGVATVVASGFSNGVSISDSLSIHMAGSGTSYRLLDDNSNVTNSVTLSSCKQDVVFFVDDGTGKSPSAGTTVTVPYVGNGGSASVKVGGTVQDIRNFAPSMLVISFDLSSLTANACNASGSGAASILSNINITSSGGTTFTKTVTINYKI